MYPRRELNDLAAAKILVRQRIAAHRVQCVEAAAVVTTPLAWIDRGVALWRRISPLVKIAAVPLAFLLKRKAAPRTSLVGSVLHWAPTVMNVVRR